MLTYYLDLVRLCWNSGNTGKMAHSVPIKDFNAQVQCLLCQRQKVGRKPRRLQCSHSYCEDCLIDKAKKGTQSEITCPLCFSVTVTGTGSVVDLPVDTEIEEVVRILQSSKRTYTCEGCQAMGTNSPASVLCETCNKRLCNDCRDFHQNDSLFKTHKIVDDICSTHVGVYTYFCNTCCRGLCTACLLSQLHRTHDVIDVVEAVGVIRRNAEAAKGKVQVKLQELETLVTETVDAETHKLSEHLKVYTDKTSRNVAKWTEAVRAVLENRRVSHMTKLDVDITEQKDACSMATNQINEIDQLLKEKKMTLVSRYPSQMLAFSQVMAVLEDAVGNIKPSPSLPKFTCGLSPQDFTKDVTEYSLYFAAHGHDTSRKSDKETQTSDLKATENKGLENKVTWPNLKQFVKHGSSSRASTFARFAQIDVILKTNTCHFLDMVCLYDGSFILARKQEPFVTHYNKEMKRIAVYYTHDENQVGSLILFNNILYLASEHGTMITSFKPDHSCEPILLQPPVNNLIDIECDGEAFYISDGMVVYKYSLSGKMLGVFTRQEHSFKMRRGTLANGITKILILGYERKELILYNGDGSVFKPVVLERSFGIQDIVMLQNGHYLALYEGHLEEFSVKGRLLNTFYFTSNGETYPPGICPSFCMVNLMGRSHSGNATLTAVVLKVVQIVLRNILVGKYITKFNVLFHTL